MRKLRFGEGKFYHVFNRGVEKRKVCLEKDDYARVIRTWSNLQNYGNAKGESLAGTSFALDKKLSLVSYCLMPNHYHILVRLKTDDGLTEFMHRFGTSYTKYFNNRYSRTGRLFEFSFKAVEVDSDELVVHVSRYIHLNPIVSGLVVNLKDWQWSSYLDYVGEREGKLCGVEEVLSYFGGDRENYRKFVDDRADYGRQLERIKKMMLE